MPVKITRYLYTDIETDTVHISGEPSRVYPSAPLPDKTLEDLQRLASKLEDADLHVEMEDK